MAHRPLAEINDATGRQRPYIFYFDDGLLAGTLNAGILRPRAILDPPNLLRKSVLMATAQAEGLQRCPEAVLTPPSRYPGRYGLYMDAAPVIAAPEAAITRSFE